MLLSAVVAIVISLCHVARGYKGLGKGALRKSHLVWYWYLWPLLVSPRCHVYSKVGHPPSVSTSSVLYFLNAQMIHSFTVSIQSISFQLLLASYVVLALLCMICTGIFIANKKNQSSNPRPSLARTSFQNAIFGRCPATSCQQAP